MKALALDLGSTEFRSLRIDGHRLVGRRIPAAYCVVDDSLSSRRLLEQTRIPYVQSQGALLVIGESAHEFAALVRCPVVPVVMEGHLPWDDPVGRQVCAVLIESLIPSFPGQQGLCGIVLPGSANRQSKSKVGFIEQLLSLSGYRMAPTNAATAICLAEFQDVEFSGVGMSIGAESVSLCVSHQGQSVFEGTFGQGFRSIEQRFAMSRHRYLWDQAGNRYYDLAGVRNWIHESNLSLVHPKSGDELWLANQIRQLLLDAVSSMLPELMRHASNPLMKRRLPVTICGGPTEIDGLTDILSDVLLRSAAPFRVQDIRHASSGALSVARGLLIQTLLTCESDLAIHAAA